MYPAQWGCWCATEFSRGGWRSNSFKVHYDPTKLWLGGPRYDGFQVNTFWNTWQWKSSTRLELRFTKAGKESHWISVSTLRFLCQATQTLLEGAGNPGCFSEIRKALDQSDTPGKGHWLISAMQHWPTLLRPAISETLLLWNEHFTH